MVIGSDLEEEDNLELQLDEENRGEPEDRSDEEHELDRIVADEGEELDEDIWAQEGYGACWSTMLEYYDDHLIQTSTSYARPSMPNTRLDDYTSESSFAIA